MIPNTQFEYYNNLYNEENPAPVEEDNIFSRFVTWDTVYTLRWESNQNNFYSVYKNEKLLVSHKMIYGAESAIQEFVLISIDNKIKEWFTFYDYFSGNDIVGGTRNIWFDGQTMNYILSMRVHFSLVIIIK